ncbi:hypothetical protein BJ973_003630 [Actinoplanes tereljensis]|uniref:Uncharacterized protein n=1 Tax=Paractinoplanes tereljensis TaxID=571912 RepID=A0A919NU84_9ACTN|nr:hypothetical protein [Actinoplanes tereljensis]GIF25351.1 hypothetical protein Ate02nite_80810 [Actinoplanes tereljensis]
MTDVQIVRGELQPWTDTHPTGGPALLALLDDLLPTASNALIAGPHSTEVIELVAARCAAVSVLFRSVTDAQELRAPENVTVITGALDGLSGEFDVVIAADGLDRVLGADSPALNWPQRAALLTGLAAPDALLVVGVENEFALTGLYDRRPVDERHGDDEWRPLHDDPDRPTSPSQVRDALGADRLYASYIAAGEVHTLLDVDAAAATRPGRPGARLAVNGLAAAATHTPLLAPVSDGADAAARAGLLAAVAPGWLAVRGAEGAAHTAYADGLLVDFDVDQWMVNGNRVPDTESVETLLFRLAAAEDVPGFRAFAARLGAWANPDGVILLDDLFPDGDDFVRGFSVVDLADETPELLAAAYHRLRDRLVRAHRRHPWPPWMTESDDLVATWLGMSGVDATFEVLARGREIADLVAEPAVAEPDLRTLLADAETARVRAKELAGKVFGLERTLRFRDQSLRTREQQIRTVRDDLRGLRRSPAMRLHEITRKVAKIRDPRKFAGAVKRRLRKS